MTRPDALIYAAHAGYWLAFIAARLLLRPPPAATSAAAPAAAPRVARGGIGALLFHTVGFWAMYYAMQRAVWPARPSQDWLLPALGALVIAAAAALMVWALAHFRSWRIRAAVDAGHQLASGGPFAWVRHPLYLSFTLLALGTAIWLPTPASAVAFVLMAISGDWRARREEALLLEVFGDAYRDYCQRVRRFIPGVY